MKIYNFRTHFFTLLGMVLLLNACQSSAEQSESPVEEMPSVFFDIKGYFAQEQKRLNQAQPDVTKKVAINGEIEQKQIDSLNFDRELKVFIQSDINRPDWVGKYRIDSVWQNNKLSELHYQALDDKLRTRQIDIIFNDGEVSKIFIENGGTNIVAGSEQELTYLPGQGYTIKSRQYTALSKDKELSIEVRFRD